MENFKMIDGKKYMWDGEEYLSTDTAGEIRTKYEGDGFETRMLQENGKHLLYTRRVVTDIQIDGEPV